MEACRDQGLQFHVRWWYLSLLGVTTRYCSMLSNVIKDVIFCKLVPEMRRRLLIVYATSAMEAPIR